MKFLTTLFLVSAANFLLAQNNRVVLQQHFQAIADQYQSTISKEQMNAFTKDPGIMDLLLPYLESQEKNQTTAAISLLTRIGSQHQNLKTRQLAVNLLLDAGQQKSLSKNTIANNLKQFNRADFDQVAKTKLMVIIQSKTPHLKEFILLAGFLNMQAELEILKEHLKKGSVQEQAWKLALTRCDNPWLANSMMKKVAEIPVNDDFIYVVVPLLIYTRSKKAMDYLFDLILSQESFCTSADEHNNSNILCAYRLMEMVAPVIQNFPVSTTISGDLAVQDYESALETVRNWITNNQEDYTLNMEVF